MPASDRGDWPRSNVTRRAVTLGERHRTERLVQYGASRNGPRGVVRWRLDTTRIGNDCEVKLAGTPLTARKLALVRGGIEVVPKTATDFVRQDPIHTGGRRFRLH